MPHFDLTIDGTSAMVARGEGTFKERSIRTEITQNVLSQAEGAGLVSRPDQARLYQTDWSGGSRWGKPIMGVDEARSFHKSNNMDTWSQPGQIVPLNKLADLGGSANMYPWILAAGKLYAVGATSVVNASQYDVF